MNLEEYKNYCEVTDYIIDQSNNYYVNSITSLNPVRPSKKLLQKIKKDKNTPVLLFLLEFLINNFKYFLKTFFSYILNLRNIYTINNDTKFHTVIISHLINKKNLKKNNDFYFGDIIKSCSNQSGIFLVQINWSKINNNEIRKFISKNKSENNRLIIGKSLDLSKEIKLYFKLIKTFFFLINKSYKNSNYKRDYMLHSRNIFSSSSVQANRIAISIEGLVKKINPKRILITFEGHSWERLTFSVVKKFNSNIQCIGYLHAGIFKHQHSLKRIHNNNYNPDLILTCGKSSYLELKENFKNTKIAVEDIGCKRYLNINKFLFIEKNYFQEDICLVLPEGDIDDLNKFIKFSKSCLKSHPNLKFIIKIHPNMTIEKVKKRYKKFTSNNLEFSDVSIEKSSLRASFVLYCGSTSIIEAISFGLLPLYLNNNSDISFDFIYGLKNINRIINCKKDFINKINYYKKINFQKLLNENLNYAKQIYSPLSKEKINNIFNLH